MVAIAFSSSVSLARFVEPRVRVAGEAVTSAALLMTFIKESWVIREEADKSKLHLIPIKPPKSVRDVQPPNASYVPITFEVFISGIVVNEEQP